MIFTGNALFSSGRSLLILLAPFFMSACGEPTNKQAPIPATSDPVEETPQGARHLFAWAFDDDGNSPDFLAVVDVDRSSTTYGEVLATLPVGVSGGMAHHIQYEYPDTDVLYANSWLPGRTFRIGLANPRQPQLLGELGEADGYSWPHSFADLPGGHVLATFQSLGDTYAPSGGLVEFDPAGRLVRSAPATKPDFGDDPTSPYSLAVMPEANIAVATSNVMGFPPWEDWMANASSHVQIWSLEPLEQIAHVPLPEPDSGPYHKYPAEPRVLEDGSVYVNTFACGLYRIEGINSPKPYATFLHAFPGDPVSANCFVPVVFDRFWIQPVPTPGLVVLDTSDPAKPVEVSRLDLDPHYEFPHWVAVDGVSGRLVVTGDYGSWMLVVGIDKVTGTLTVDETFVTPGNEHPGFTFDRTTWPHGNTGKAIVHGVVFGP